LVLAALRLLQRAQVPVAMLVALVALAQLYLAQAVVVEALALLLVLMEELVARPPRPA
jgi:hypothetical protein